MQILLQGYGYSGVSFLRDFFKEICETFVFDEEFDLIRKSGGILELENVLCQNNPFLDDCVIRNFANFYNYLANDRNWKSIMGEEFCELSQKLISDLILCKKIWVNKGFQVQNSIKYPKDKFGIHKNWQKEIKRLNEDENIYFLKPLTIDEIHRKLIAYTKSIIRLFPQKKYLCLVHALQISSLIKPQLKYFDEDVKIITISRDPRDVFIDMKLMDDVTSFIQYYKKWHLNDKENFVENPCKLLNIKFEDFVLNYDKVEKEILDFCKIDITSHVKRMKYSNPEISKKNIGLYKDYANQKEIKLIENELCSYLYGDGINSR